MQPTHRVENEKLGSIPDNLPVVPLPQSPPQSPPRTFVHDPYARAQQTDARVQQNDAPLQSPPRTFVHDPYARAQQTNAPLLEAPIYPPAGEEVLHQPIAHQLYSYPIEQLPHVQPPATSGARLPPWRFGRVVLMGLPVTLMDTMKEQELHYMIAKIVGFLGVHAHFVRVGRTKRGNAMWAKVMVDLETVWDLVPRSDTMFVTPTHLNIARPGAETTVGQHLASLCNGDGTFRLLRIEEEDTRDCVQRRKAMHGLQPVQYQQQHQQQQYGYYAYQQQQHQQQYGQGQRQYRGW